MTVKSTWEGIVVEGGNGDFDVKLINSIVENTSRAAVSTFAGNGNGILLAENTVFNNCRRLAELTVGDHFQILHIFVIVHRMVVNMGLPIGIVKELKFPIPPLMGYLTIVLLLKQGLLLENNIFKSGMNDVFFNNPSAV